MTLKELRERYNAACKRVQETADAVEALAADATTDAIDAASAENVEAVTEAERCKTLVTQREAVERSREAHPAPEPIERTPTPDRPAPQARGALQTEQVYRLGGEHSYLRDMLLVKESRDKDAIERLVRSNEERRVEGKVARDMSTGVGVGFEFLPPLYLANLVVFPSIASRAFANALPNLPLPLEGTDISIPQLTGGGSVDVRADGGVVSETDGATASITHKVREIAGQVDIGRIDVMRSNPAIDQIIVQLLTRRYNAKFDDQLINGTGVGQQHIGLRNVTGPNTTSFVDGAPTAAKLVPKIYDAIQKVDTNSDEDADLVLMHPRRSAWLASNLSSTFPLFQLGGYFQAAGAQDNGFTTNIAGLEPIKDRNVGTALGAGTEDEVYVLSRQDFILMEGPLQTRVFEDVGSGTGTIRYQVFAHSAFLSNRYPKSLTIISGTGLIAPTF